LQAFHQCEEFGIFDTFVKRIDNPKLRLRYRYLE
jgi:hypothetical protein